MNFFTRFFGRSKDYKERDTRKFGRYSDAYKSKEKYQLWDASLEAFQQNNYLDSFDYLLNYLLDKREENVLIEKNEDDQINFTIYQGSKLIRGSASNRHFKAEAKISIVNRQNIAFLRRLLEHNYALKYCRYALDKEENLTMVFYSQSLDASPYKIYYALKELATKVDKQDDILEGEFSNLVSINNAHITQSTQKEKDVKFNFFQAQIETAISQIDNSSYNFVKFPGAVSYILLSTVYKLDYLVKPEGTLMEVFEKVHRNFFKHDNTLPQKKNSRMMQEIKKMRRYTKEEFNKEMYEVVSTFGITSPTGHDRLTELIRDELKNISWYIKQGENDIALYICDYIVGYCLFNYSLPEPDKELLHLFYEILHYEYFRKLGFENSFWHKKKLNKNTIQEEIIRTTDFYKSRYDYNYPDTDHLDFRSKVGFAKSYLTMLSNWQIEALIK